tara:strand:- start:536 stop:826 length:291 start_codon:yes stop_codon:yes gene_type:complete
MSYGMKIFDSSANEIFSTTDSTFTLLGVYTSNADTSTTHTNVPIMPTRIVTRIMVDQISGDDESYVHTFNLSGSTLTTTAPSATETVKTIFMVFGK